MTGNTGVSMQFACRVVATLSFLIVIGMATAGDEAHAHSVRYIASNGNDSNTCTRTAPCLTLQRGINKTAAGSELVILDSGDFGDGATVDKSITISAVGVSATIGGGITIDSADATVVLRGLRLNGAGAAAAGVHIVNAVAVHIVDCEVQNFGSTGIFVITSADTNVFVSESVVRNNSFNGLYFSTGAGGALTVNNSRFARNGTSSSYSGLNINSGEARISRTITSGNSGEGIRVFGGLANIVWTTAAHNGGSGYRVQGAGRMAVEQSITRGNAYGLRVNQSGTVAVLSSSVVTDNNIGLSVAAGSTLLTRGNSTVSGNTTDVSGTLTILAGQ